MNKKKIKKFLDKYREKYSNILMDGLLDEICNGYSKSDDKVNQILCHLRLVDKKNTDYYTFYQVLQENFDIDSKNTL